MKITSILFLFLMFHSLVQAQLLPGGTELVPNCACKSYKILYPETNRYKIYFADSAGRPAAAFEMEENYVVNVDSFYYDHNGRVIKINRYNESDPSVIFSTQEYSYTASGKQASHTIYSKGKMTQALKYTWDQKEFPLLFTQTLYKPESGEVAAKYKLSFRFVNDSVAVLENKDFEVVLSGKRIYNKEGNVTKEYVAGKSENFRWEYDRNGRLLYISKTKEPLGTLRFFDTDHYEGLAGPNTKQAYRYDSKGRLEGITLYKAEQAGEVKFVYEE